MSSRYGGRGYGRYGDSDEDRTDERSYERDAERGYGSVGGGLRRGGYAGGRARDEREYGRERDYDARDLGSRDYGQRDYGSRYGSRYGREVLERGGYSPRRHESEDYGRAYGARAYGRDYGRRVERPNRPTPDEDEVRDFDTDYGRTTSRFYGRSGYEYGRDDYEDERDRRMVLRGRDDEEERGESWLDRAADQVRSWFGSEDERGRHEDDPRREYRRGEGMFRGRGPRNYRRSDERIRDEVCDRLTDSEWLDASDVEVNVVAAEVILTGTVDSRYAKRLAEDIAASVSGVSNVQNSLRVQGYQAVTEAAAETPLAGMDTPLPTPSATTTPASDITATSSTTDINDIGRPSSKAAGRN